MGRKSRTSRASLQVPRIRGFMSFATPSVFRVSPRPGSDFKAVAADPRCVIVGVWQDDNMQTTSVEETLEIEDPQNPADYLAP